MTFDAPAPSTATTVIAIDGPSGSGKGTIASRLAQHLGFHLLDSGAIYRLLGLAARQIGLLDEERLPIPALENVAKGLHFNFRTDHEHVLTIFLNGLDVTHAIRTEQVGRDASLVAAVPEVRTALLERQQVMAALPGLVADGRDMGTVVFPYAPVKIYLTASAQARAERRLLQLVRLGLPADYPSILQDIQARDRRDSERSIAPLQPAADALIIDASDLSIDQVLRCSIEHIQRCGVVCPPLS